jgi:hypothetical protein
MTSHPIPLQMPLWVRAALVVCIGCAGLVLAAQGWCWLRRAGAGCGGNSQSCGVDVMKTSQQMFGKVARDIARQEQSARDDAADRERRVQEAEERLDEPLTRREVLEAIESVANDYGCNGDHDSMLIADAFRKLAEALR